MTVTSLETITESEFAKQVKGNQKVEFGIPKNKKSKKMKKQAITFRCIEYNPVIGNVI